MVSRSHDPQGLGFGGDFWRNPLAEFFGYQSISYFEISIESERLLTHRLGYLGKVYDVTDFLDGEFGIFGFWKYIAYFYIGNFIDHPGMFERYG